MFVEKTVSLQPENSIIIEHGSEPLPGSSIKFRRAVSMLMQVRILDVQQ